METKEIQLTKGEIYLLMIAIMAINEKNKTSNYFDGNYKLVKKILSVKKTLATDWEAIQEAKPTIDVLFADKELIDFTVPVFTDEDCEKMLFDIEKAEAFEKLIMSS